MYYRNLASSNMVSSSESCALQWFQFAERRKKPIARLLNQLLQLEGRGQGQTFVEGFVMIELFDGTMKFFADRSLRQVILHFVDAGH